MNKQIWKNLGWWIMVLCLCGVSAHTLKAQEQSPIEISGFMQILGQMGSAGAPMKVGSERDAHSNEYRMGIRRGQLTAIRQKNGWMGRIDVGISEKSVVPFFLYFRKTWESGHFIHAGLSPIPFGFELPFSTTKRETWERSNYISDLFPEERDFLVQAHFQQGWQEGKHLLSTDVALLSGEGTQIMNSRTPKLLGKVEMTHKMGSNSLTYGFSGYWGQVPQANLNRTYLGAHLVSQLKGEIFQSRVSLETMIGNQPGSVASNSISGIYRNQIEAGKVGIRPFVGATLFATCRHRASQVEGVAKYTYYDRNRNYSKNQASNLYSTPGYGIGRDLYDGTSHTITLGTNWYTGANDKIKLSALYEINAYQTQTYSQEKLAHPLTHLLTIGIQYTL